MGADIHNRTRASRKLWAAIITGILLLGVVLALILAFALPAKSPSSSDNLGRSAVSSSSPTEPAAPPQEGSEELDSSNAGSTFLSPEVDGAANGGAQGTSDGNNEQNPINATTTPPPPPESTPVEPSSPPSLPPPQPSPPLPDLQPPLPPLSDEGQTPTSANTTSPPLPEASPVEPSSPPSLPPPQPTPPLPDLPPPNSPVPGQVGIQNTTQPPPDSNSNVTGGPPPQPEAPTPPPPPPGPPSPQVITGPMADPTGSHEKPKPDMTEYDGETIIEGDGDPGGTLGKLCRETMSEMFANSSDCDSKDLLTHCSSSSISNSEWRLLCLSGLYKDSTSRVFTPSREGDLKASWGSANYLQQLGRIGAKLNATTTNEDQSSVYAAVKGSAILGPVLQAVIQDKARSHLTMGVLLTWTMSISQIPTPLSRDHMTRLVLGNVALESLRFKCSLDSSLDSPTPPPPTNSTSNSSMTGQEEGRSLQGIPLDTSPADRPSVGTWFPQAYPSADAFYGIQDDTPISHRTVSSHHGRELQTQESQLQFLRMPFRFLPSLGSGYSRNLTSITGSSASWSSGWSVNVPFVQSDVIQINPEVACGNRNISRLLQAIGMGSFVGDSADVPASASFADNFRWRTVCAAARVRRVQDRGTEISLLRTSSLPVLSLTARQVLGTGGISAFERTYGAYFVLTYLRQAQFGVVCYGFAREDRFWYTAMQRFQGNYAPFSADMETRWNSSRDSGEADYVCRVSNNKACLYTPSIRQMADCAAGITTSTVRDEAYAAVLMRFSDLPSFTALIPNVVPPSLVTPPELGDRGVTAEFSVLWARSLFAYRTWSRASDPEMFRIQGVASAMIAVKPISPASRVVLYLNSSYTNQTGNALLTSPTQSITLNGGRDFQNKAISSLMIGPGLLVTLYESMNFGGRSLMLGSDISGLNRLLDSFDDLTSQITIESIEAMTEGRRRQVLQRLQEDMYRIEVIATWVSGCQERTTQTGDLPAEALVKLDKYNVTCGNDEVLQQFRLFHFRDREGAPYGFRFTCCKFTSFASALYSMRTVPSRDIVATSDYRIFADFSNACPGPTGSSPLAGVRFRTVKTPGSLWANCVSWAEATTRADWRCNQSLTSLGAEGVSCGRWEHIPRQAQQAGCGSGWGKGFCSYTNGGSDSGYSTSCARFDNTCLVPAAGNSTQVTRCRSVFTAYQGAGGGWTVFMDRHDIRCEWDERLAQFVLLLDPYSRDRVRFQYTCCAMPQ